MYKAIIYIRATIALLACAVVGNLFVFPVPYTSKGIYDTFLSRPIGTTLIYFFNPYAYFVGYILICLSWYSLLYFFSKTIRLINLITPNYINIGLDWIEKIDDFIWYNDEHISSTDSNDNIRIDKTEYPEILSSKLTPYNKPPLKIKEIQGSLKTFPLHKKNIEPEINSKKKSDSDGYITSNTPDKAENINNAGFKKESKGTNKPAQKEETSPIIKVESKEASTDEYTENKSSTNDQSSPPKKWTGNPNTSKPDWIGIGKRKMKIGEIGEEIVFRFISENLKKWGYENTGEYIDHASKTKGDGLGYDICTVDKQGRKIFIEVKTTTSSNKLDFILTRNELEFLSRNKSDYSIYRIYNLDQKEKAYDLIIYDAEEILNQFILDPHEYKVSW